MVGGLERRQQQAWILKIVKHDVDVLESEFVYNYIVCKAVLAVQLLRMKSLKEVRPYCFAKLS